MLTARSIIKFSTEVKDRYEETDRVNPVVMLGAIVIRGSGCTG
jgi:hypothetical protein